MVAIEDEYRAYRQAISAGTGILRPSVEVSTAGLDILQEELAHLRPQLVVCSRSTPSYADGVHTWVELPVDPTQPMKVSRGGRSPEPCTPTLESLLAVIDETEEISRIEGLLGGERP
jgi:hypothetical protein